MPTIETTVWFGTEPEAVALINTLPISPPWFDVVSNDTQVMTISQDSQMIGYAFLIPKDKVLQVVWIHWEPGYARKVIKQMMLEASRLDYADVAVLIDTDSTGARDKMEELLRGEFLANASNRKEHVWLLARCI